MGGGLMQLVAYGAQDIYLTGNPQITFFKVVYRRHTNFSMEAIEQTFNGSLASGGSQTATISRNGDLVHRMYLEVATNAATVATVDDNWNSAYPYAVGPTFYGVYSNAAVSSVNESTTVYTPSSTDILEDELGKMDVSVFPNPGSELIASQVGQLVKNDILVELLDMSGRIVKTSKINSGSTIAFFDIQTVYEGAYCIRLSNSKNKIIKKVMIIRE